MGTHTGHLRCHKKCIYPVFSVITVFVGIKYSLQVFEEHKDQLTPKVHECPKCKSLGYDSI